MIEAHEERSPLDELDPRIINSESYTTLMEELESFSANLDDLGQVLKIRKTLPFAIKEELI